MGEEEEALGHRPCVALSLQNPAEEMKLENQTGLPGCCNLWMDGHHEAQQQVAEYGIF